MTLNLKYIVLLFALGFLFISVDISVGIENDKLTVCEIDMEGHCLYARSESVGGSLGKIIIDPNDG